MGSAYTERREWLISWIAIMRSEFEAAGYVSLPGFLSSTEVEEWRQEWARVRQSVVPELADAEVYYEEPADPRSLKQVQQLWKHDSWFHEDHAGTRMETNRTERN